MSYKANYLLKLPCLAMKGVAKKNTSLFTDQRPEQHILLYKEVKGT